MVLWFQQTKIGTPTTPTDPENPEKPDPSLEAIKGLGDNINNQTHKIEEQTNAINNQTQKIDEQTNSIKEANETNKNIFQKIIELPKLIIDGFLNMLKSLFIPSEDFFTKWLDDLNSYFGDVFRNIILSI